MLGQVKIRVRVRLAEVQEASFKARKYEHVKARAFRPLWLKHKLPREELDISLETQPGAYPHFTLIVTF